jgi:adenosylmethionine-8-amino-7-oxononanoate aminotransferase
VSEIRQCGFIAAIEVTTPKLALDVCLRARERGLLTRPLGNVIVLMPPLCITPAQLSTAVAAIRESIVDLRVQ